MSRVFESQVSCHTEDREGRLVLRPPPLPSDDGSSGRPVECMVECGASDSTGHSTIAACRTRRAGHVLSPLLLVRLAGDSQAGADRNCRGGSDPGDALWRRGVRRFSASHRGSLPPCPCALCGLLACCGPDDRHTGSAGEKARWRALYLRGPRRSPLRIERMSVRMRCDVFAHPFASWPVVRVGLFGRSSAGRQPRRKSLPR
jgi:hypothetical protein